MRRTACIVGTVIIHLLMITMLLNFSSKKIESDPAQQTEVSVALTLYDLDADKSKTTTQEQNLVDSTALVSVEECPDDTETYRGIGVLYSAGGVITSAPESLPAYKAGIRVDDILLDPFRDVTEPTTVVHILRRGVEMWITSDVQDICYQ